MKVKKSELYSLTEEHRAQLKPWADHWIKNAMSTQPMTDDDRAACREAVRKLYLAAGLTPPPDHRIVFVSSPFVMRFAAGFAAAIWYVRKNLGGNFPSIHDEVSAASYAIHDAAYNATLAATSNATSAATRDAVYNATLAATYNATSAATSAATYNATLTAILYATSAATLAATSDTVYNATSDAVYNATLAATSDTVYNATSDTNDPYNEDRWYNLSPKVMVQLASALKVGSLGLQFAHYAYQMGQGGNQGPSLDSFLAFFRHVVKLPLDYSKYDSWETLALRSGPRIVHEEFCIISDRPRALKVNGRNQPHCDSGPFCEWSDGTAIYAINGVFVPKWLAVTPKEKLDLKRIVALENAEQRAQGIKKAGIEQFREILKVEVLDRLQFKVPYEGDYELWTIEVEGRRIGPYLWMKNPSTGEIHVEGVGDPDKYESLDTSITTCVQAIEFRYPNGLKGLPKTLS